LIDQHSTPGKVVGTLTAILAVAVFALPVGVVGSGFDSVIASRRKAEDSQPIVEESQTTLGFHASNSTLRGRIYNFMHSRTERRAVAVDHFVNILVVTTSIAFMLETLDSIPWQARGILEVIELLSVVTFTIEYAFRVWSVVEDPKYAVAGGRFLYATCFLSVVDLLSFAPYWLEIMCTGKVVTAGTNTSEWGNAVKSLRLLRILRFERYTHAFLSFDDVIRRNLDVLSVTAFTAILFWIFFSSCLYYSERNSLDEEMASFYNTIPNSMWVTLLNLSGESPLAQYSATGKIITGVLGLFATA
jgi:voltage-gated potassium channel